MARIRNKEYQKNATVRGDNIKKAAAKVLSGEMSYREAAAVYNVSKTTLNRHVSTFKKSEQPNCNFKYISKIQSRKIFTDDEEEKLVDYILQASKYYYGLTINDARTLAYEYASANKKNIPLSWEHEKRAGKDWYIGFKRRYNAVFSLRKLEATSLSRATSFTRENLNKFYDNLESILQRQNFTASQIYNLDESGISTVHVPPKVIAGKGIKQVGQMTSGERGKLVTIIAAVNAIGNSVPPLLVFPRKFFKEHMLKGASSGTIGAANPSGWSSPQIFIIYLKHFVKHVKTSKDNNIILILDNHNTHITIEAIDFCKENGINMLTLPPHTSHKIQPLDRTVFSSFKVHYNVACSQWMVNHAGRPISIYDVAECVGNAYPLSFTPKNIVSGFQVTGIYPFNREIFDDSEFLSAFVTDRAIPSTSLSPQSNSESPIADLSKPKTPESVRPFPKAPPRKASNRGRKRGRSAICTDTPEKKAIEDAITDNEKKSQVKEKESMNLKVKKKIKKQLQLSISSSSEDEDLMLSELVGSSSSGRKPVISDLCNDDSDDDVYSFDKTKDETRLNVGDFVVAKFAGKRYVVAFIGHVERIDGDEYELSFLRRLNQSLTFIYPEKEDKSYVNSNDILLKLKEPEQSTERSLGLVFDSQQLFTIKYKIC